MDKELIDYYDHQFNLFSTQGWKDLMDDFREMQKATDRISGVKPEDVRFKQGELSIINLVLSREDMTRKAFDELQKEDEAAF